MRKNLKDKILNIYDSAGRAGNIILLCLLIFFGMVNRFYMVYQYRDIEYIIEIFLIAVAAYLVVRIFRKNTFEFDNRKIFRRLLMPTSLSLPADAGEMLYQSAVNC